MKYKFVTPICNENSFRMRVYSIGYSACRSGYGYGPAVRDKYLVHYIHEGCGIFTIDGQTYNLKAGQGFLIPPYKTTYYQADKRKPWTYYWIAFNGGETKELIYKAGLGKDKFTFSVKDDTEIMAVFDRFLNKPCNQYHYIAGVYSIFGDIVDSSDDAIIKTQTHIDKAIEYIDKNYSDHITVAQVAEHVGIDRSYMYKLFKQHTGYSPQQILLNTRLSASRQMISDESYSIAEIAYACGFESVGYFSNAFKNKYGASPIKFRQQLRKLLEQTEQ